MSRRVLIVDDDPILRAMFTRHFRRLGYDAIVVSDVDTAREIAARATFAIILTDYHLDGANGLDLIEDLSELQPDASAIIMSGDPAVAESAAARGLSRLAILLKPFGAADLVEILKEGLARYLVRATARDRDEEASIFAIA